MLPALRHDPHNSLSAVSVPDLHPELELLQITFAHAPICATGLLFEWRDFFPPPPNTGNIYGCQTNEKDKATVGENIYICNLQSDGEEHI